MAILTPPTLTVSYLKKNLPTIYRSEKNMLTHHV